MIVCNGEFEALVGQLTCEVTAGDWVDQLPQVEADALASFGEVITGQLRHIAGLLASEAERHPCSVNAPSRRIHAVRSNQFDDREMSVELRLDLTVGMDAGAAWGILDQCAGAIHGRLVATSLNDEEKMTLRIAKEEGKRRAKTLFLTLGDLHGLFQPEGQDPVG